jgi:predicted nucleotidyltransferase
MICQTGSMDEARAAEVMAESASVLRNAGARFAYLHGSRASGQYRPDSDVDMLLVACVERVASPTAEDSMSAALAEGFPGPGPVG